jgi:uncharacterized protein (TIGR04255 family)
MIESQESMSLRFSKKQEIMLHNLPLQEVICQARFPVILKIIKKDPGEFQEKIRHWFPELTISFISTP